MLGFPQFGQQQYPTLQRFGAQQQPSRYAQRAASARAQAVQALKQFFLPLTCYLPRAQEGVMQEQPTQVFVEQGSGQYAHLLAVHLTPEQAQALAATGVFTLDVRDLVDIVRYAASDVPDAFETRLPQGGALSSGW